MLHEKGALNDSTHNSYFDYALAYGIPCTILYLIIIVRAIVRGIKMKGTFIVTIVFTPFLISSIGTEEYGLYSLMLSIVAYFALLNFGTGNTIVRYLSKNRVKGNKEKEAQIAGFFIKFYFIISIVSVCIGILLFFKADLIFSSLLHNHFSV